MFRVRIIGGDAARVKGDDKRLGGAGGAALVRRGLRLPPQLVEAHRRRDVVDRRGAPASLSREVG